MILSSYKGDTLKHRHFTRDIIEECAKVKLYPRELWRKVAHHLRITRYKTRRAIAYRITFRTPRVRHVPLHTGHKVITEAAPRHVGGSISVAGVEGADGRERKERRRARTRREGIAAQRTRRRKRDELFIEFRLGKLSRCRTAVRACISPGRRNS